MAVFPINSLLIKKRIITYNDNITIFLNGVNNIRLRKYKINVRNNDFIKRTNIYDNFTFFNALNFF